MKEMAHLFDDLKDAQEFSQKIWGILMGELTETDDTELKHYIEFFKENPRCEMVIRKRPDGVEIGLAIAQDRPMDDFEDWGSNN